MARALILYASVEGHTARVAQRIAEKLRAVGHRVDVAPAASGLVVSGYDGVMVGASVHYGRHPAALARALRAARLPSRRAAFFSVSLGAKARYAQRFLRQARWQPELVAVFAGALKYSRYGTLKRLAVRAFVALGGHDIDPSRDYEYTDWASVDAFAAAFSRILDAGQKSPARARQPAPMESRTCTSTS